MISSHKTSHRGTEAQRTQRNTKEETREKKEESKKAVILNFFLSLRALRVSVPPCDGIRENS